MIYVDTSFLVPYFLKEPTSGAVEAKLMRVAPGNLCISMWTKAEFASVLARKVRMRECSAIFADSTFARFENMALRYYQVWEPISADFETAARFMRNYETGLRAGDALHLAIAHNRATLDLFTLDAGLARAANLLGISASSGI